MMPYEMHKFIYPLGIKLPAWFIFHYWLAWPFGFYYLIRESMRRKDIRLDYSLQMVLFGFLGTVAGARLFAFFGPWKGTCASGLFWQRFVMMFSTNSSGWVALGGLLGGIMACWAYTRIKRIDTLSYMDAAAPAVALGFAIARIGCFISGCCWGSPADVPWAIIKDGVPIHPTQLYNSMMDLLIFIALLHLNEKKEREKRSHGCIIFSFLLMYSFGRFLTEYLRGDYATTNFFYGLTSSQMVCILLFIISAFMLIMLRGKKEGISTPLRIRHMSYALIFSGGLIADMGAYIFTPHAKIAAFMIVTGLVLLFAGVRSVFSFQRPSGKKTKN